MKELLESLEKYIEVRQTPKVNPEGVRTKEGILQELRAFSDLKTKWLEYQNECNKNPSN